MEKEAIGLSSLGTVAKTIKGRIGGAFTTGAESAKDFGFLARTGEGISHAAHAAWENKGLAGKALGSYVKTKPLQAAAIGGGVLAAGYGAKKLLSSPQQPTYQNINYA
jgi:hypothetical protein